MENFFIRNSKIIELKSNDFLYSNNAILVDNKIVAITDLEILCDLKMFKTTMCHVHNSRVETKHEDSNISEIVKSKTSSEENLLNTELNTSLKIEYFFNSKHYYFLISNTNTIFLIHKKLNKITEIGTFEHQIILCRFSPLEKFCVIILQNKEIYLLNENFEAIKNTHISTDIALPDMFIHTNHIFFNKEALINLEWSDQNKFAIIFNTKILIYNTELENISISLNFKPNGSISWNSKYNTFAVSSTETIYFIEPNGLLHHSPLNTENTHISYLDSNLLLVFNHLKEFNELKIFFFSNFKWYLKIHKFISKTQIYMSHHKNIILIKNKRNIIKYYFYKEITYQDTHFTVINGKNIYFYNYQNKIIPPPFFSNCISLSYNIVDICFSNHKIFALTSATSSICTNKAKDSKDSIITFASDSINLSPIISTHISYFVETIKIEKDTLSIDSLKLIPNIDSCSCQIIYISNNEVGCFCKNIQKTFTNSIYPKISENIPKKNDEIITNIFSDILVINNTIYLKKENSSILKMFNFQNSLSLLFTNQLFMHRNISFILPCIKTMHFQFFLHKNILLALINTQLHIINLEAENKINALPNSSVINTPSIITHIPNTLSFITNNNYLITSSKHVYSIYKLDPFNLIETLPSDNNPHILCIKNNTTLISYINRGSIESLTPKTLVTERIKNYILENKYQAAITLINTYSLNYSVLFDNKINIKELLFSCRIVNAKCYSSKDGLTPNSLITDIFLECYNMLNKENNIPLCNDCLLGVIYTNYTSIDSRCGGVSIAETTDEVLKGVNIVETTDEDLRGVSIAETNDEVLKGGNIVKTMDKDLTGVSISETNTKGVKGVNILGATDDELKGFNDSTHNNTLCYTSLYLTPFTDINLFIFKFLLNLNPKEDFNSVIVILYFIGKVDTALVFSYKLKRLKNCVKILSSYLSYHDIFREGMGCYNKSLVIELAEYCNEDPLKYIDVLKGVNDIGTVLVGVNKMDIKEGGVNNVIDKQQGVKNGIDKHKGVNDNTNEQEGVNDSGIGNKTIFIDKTLKDSYTNASINSDTNSTSYEKFLINDYLGRKNIALYYLLLINDKKKEQEYIKRNNLYLFATKYDSLYNKEENDLTGVNVKDSNHKGFNSSINEQQGDNDYTNRQQRVNNSTYDYNPLLRICLTKYFKYSSYKFTCNNTLPLINREPGYFYSLYANTLSKEESYKIYCKIKDLKNALIISFELFYWEDCIKLYNTIRNNDTNNDNTSYDDISALPFTFEKLSYSRKDIQTYSSLIYLPFNKFLCLFISYLLNSKKYEGVGYLMKRYFNNKEECVYYFNKAGKFMESYNIIKSVNYSGSEVKGVNYSGTEVKGVNNISMERFIIELKGYFTKSIEELENIKTGANKVLEKVERLFERIKKGVEMGIGIDDVSVSSFSGVSEGGRKRGIGGVKKRVEECTKEMCKWKNEWNELIKALDVLKIEKELHLMKGEITEIEDILKRSEEVLNGIEEFNL